MRIIMKVSVAGPGFSYALGEAVDIIAELAEELIRAGYAAQADVRDARNPTGGSATAKASTTRRRSRDGVRDGK